VGAGAGGNLTILGAERVVIHGMDAGVPNPDPSLHVDPRRAALTAFTETGSTGSGGSLSVTSQVVEVLDGGQASTTTQGDGDAGPLTIQAGERVSVRGGPNGPSFVSSDSRVKNNVLPQGAGGVVEIDTRLFEALDGGRVTASTDGTRDAGGVRITAQDVVISGVTPTPAQIPSVVQSRSNSNRPDGGGGGPIGIVATGDVTVSDRGEIASSTAGGGDAGFIDLRAAGRLLLERLVSIAARTEGGSSGAGGSIRFLAGRGISISESSVATESLGDGLAGDITIEAGPSLEVSDGSITTASAKSSGGNITIVADQIVHLEDGSELTTSVISGVGGGGNIDIDPEFVVVDRSTIKANAEGGDGGDITITTGTFFKTPDSEITASSEFGVDGTIAIVAPDTDVTSGITTLPAEVLDATALMRNACSAATAEGGSFVVSARPGLPVSPDALLAAFDERTTQTAAATADSGAPAPRVAVAGALRACRRVSEEVL
jgi:large exoprotein involved in heme utilization and adhesion